MAIYDTMQYVKPNIQTLCVGQAASLAAVLLAAGTKGKRFALPNSRVVIHQPLIMGGGLSGQATEIDIHAKDIMRMRQRMNEILSRHTGQTVEKIDKDTDRDYILQAQEAVDYGIVDQVMLKRE